MSPNSGSGVHANTMHVNGIRDLSCNEYNTIIASRIKDIALNSESLRTNPETGWVRPVAFTARPGINKGDVWSAGGVFNTGFPSQCFTCIITNPPPTGNVSGSGAPNCVRNPKIGINQILLAKKNYMLQNSKNNVVSGDAAGINAYARNKSLGGFGGGQTWAQRWTRVARGAAPSGKPAQRYGLQNVRVTTPNQYANPHIDNWAKRVNFSLIPCQARRSVPTVLPPTP
jgi:hypothetical protein